MNVRYSRRAQADIRHIHDFLEQRNPRATTAVAAAIYRQVARLASHPFMGPATKRADVRSLTIPRYPYKVYYRIRHDDVLILHVRDTRRAPWKGAE